ncbi:MAG: hypothetical protein ABJH07_07000 [Sedimentitalea sp.]|uniref:hypothetical protein n=1 Tax=Sedimentitalea sp. TaxID=2048915 RepID=UPI0032634297
MTNYVLTVPRTYTKDGQERTTYFRVPETASATGNVKVMVGPNDLASAHVPAFEMSRNLTMPSGSKIRSSRDRHPNGQIGAARGGHETRDGARLTETRPGRLDQPA